MEIAEERGPVQMPVGIRDGRLLWISDAPNGLYPGVVCLCCKHPVIAKQGDANQWHFSHAPLEPPQTKRSLCDSSTAMPISTCTRESYLHAAAIQVVCGAIERATSEGRPLPLRWASNCFHGVHRYADIITTEPPTLRANSPYENIRPDITLARRGRVVAFMEIIVTHKPEEVVYSKGLPVIEMAIGNMDDITRLRHELYATHIANNPE